MIDAPEAHYSFGTRQFLKREAARLLRADDDDAAARPNATSSNPRLVIAEGRASDATYARELSSARFCLCLPGYYAFTPRTVEAPNAGCVPANVSPAGADPRHLKKIHLPFERTLDWSSFSLFLDQRVLMTPGGLQAALLNVEHRRWRGMVEALDAVRLRLIWEAHGGSAWATLLEELSRNETRR